MKTTTSGNAIGHAEYSPEVKSIPANGADHYDVVVMGGALSGGATATLLLRKNPGLRLLIVEKSERLGRRVGEATVEVSAYFMSRVLGLTQYLNESHLVKQGLRFWFTSPEVKDPSEASEPGGRYQVRLPSYQLDRATFDEEVLRRACLAGAELFEKALLIPPFSEPFRARFFISCAPTIAASQEWRVAGGRGMRSVEATVRNAALFPVHAEGHGRELDREGMGRLAPAGNHRGLAELGQSRKLKTLLPRRG
jgi:hypothetical protein